MLKELNSRQKLVLMNALKGMNQTDSYEAVYGHSPATYKCASELFNKPHFKAELQRRQEGSLRKVTDSVLSKAEKRNILASFARSRLVDLLDSDGNTKIDKNSPAAQALKEYSKKTHFDRDGNPVTSQSLKLIDPIAAIMEDNKMTGDYAPSKHLVAQRIEFEVNLVDRNKRVTVDE